LEGWIIRIYPDYSRNKIKAVILLDNYKIITRYIYYNTKIYLTCSDKNLINRILTVNSEYIIDYKFEDWFYPPWYQKTKKIWVLKLLGINEYRTLLNKLIKDGRFIIWNIMPSIVTQMLYEYDLSTYTFTDIKNFRSLEAIWDIEYNIPRFKRVLIRLLDWYGDVIYPFKYSPKKIYVNYIDGSQEYDEIYTDPYHAINEIIRFNPHIYEAYYGITFKWLNSVYKGFINKDYIYIDYSSTVLGCNDFPGFIELARLSRIDLNLVSSYSIGKILTNIESLEAFKMRRLIPYIKADGERFKSISKLVKIDRGGYIYTPEPGLYFNVAQCDFTSLYPSIIAKYNIGSDTVNYRECSNYIVSPDSKHKICLDYPSIVSGTIKKLLKRRIILKDLYKIHGDHLAGSRQRALKWILVTSFGYLGYRNSRFGKIEAYESVTSYARDILSKAIKLASERGFKIIHAYIDSIIVSKKDASRDDYLDLCKFISREIGFRMDLDRNYKWLYIPPNSNIKNIAVLNRYYGVDYFHNIVIKGFRRDYPRIIREFIYDIIKLFTDVSCKKDFIKLYPSINKLLQRYILNLRSLKVKYEKLIITKNIRKNLRGYKVYQPHIKAAYKLNLKYIPLIRYIMSIDGPIPVELWKESYKLDINYYINLLEKVYKEFLFNKFIKK